jgi:DNA adenine methylase
MSNKSENKKQYIPFIKWVGGKRAIAGEILNIPGIYQKNPFKFYIEPFLGGGAMFFHLKNINLIVQDTKVRLSDMNKSLINTYLVIRDECASLIIKLEEHKKNHSKKSWYNTKEGKIFSKYIKSKKRKLDPGHYYYYYVRDIIYNKLHKKLDLTVEEKIDLAAAFIYLNRTGFNGMYRENADGEMNIPRGRYSNPAIVNADVLQSASEALQGVEIEHCPYQDSLMLAAPGTLVYFDPPYYETFTDYNGGGFGEQEQLELAQLAMRAAKSGVKVIISNSSNVFTRELYKKHGFEFNFIKAARNINSDGQGRSKVEEIVAFKIKQNESCSKK